MKKQELQEWLNDPVTKDYFQAVKIRIEDQKEILSYQAGRDPENDSAMRGYIQACRDLSEMPFTELEDEDA
jgi:hypothetical protein